MSLLFFLLPVSTHAQDELSLEASSFGEESILFQDIPSVFGASKYEQKVTEAPSSVSIVTEDEIKKYGYETLTDILASMRGFYSKDDRNYEYIGVRGFGVPEDYNSRILVLIDGHRINDNIYDGAEIGYGFQLDIDLIDRVEVIRGPSSSIYGTSAFFGVVNIITKKGRDYKGVEASASGGSDDTYETRLTYGEKFQNGVEMLISGTYYDSNGDSHLYYKEFDTPFTNYGYASHLDGERAKSFFAELSYQDFTLQSTYVSRDKDIPTAPYDTMFNAEPMWTVDEQFYITLNYDHLFDNEWTISGALDYNTYYYRGEYEYHWDDMPGYFQYRATNHDTTDGRWVHGEAQADKTFFEKHRVSFGTEYQYDLRKKQTNYDKTPGGIYRYLDDDHEGWNFALYIQDEFTITDELILSAGVRYDYYSTFGNTVNPRIGLIYNPFEKTTFKLLYGSAFRAPNAFELYYEDDGNTTKDNPGLDPEEIDTYELIYEQYFGDHYRGTIVGFYYEIDDFISQVRDPRDRLLAYENTSQIDTYGVEFEVDGKWENGLEGRASYTFQRTKNRDTGNILSNSPKNLFKLNLIVPLYKDKVFLGLEEFYVSKRKTVYGSYVGEYVVTNLTLFTKNIFKGLELSGSIYNLFDETYKDPGAYEHRQAGIEQDGRTFRVKLTYAF
jgi:iron complex outermembrane receptor protein